MRIGTDIMRDDAIKEELKKLRGQKANKGVSEEELQKIQKRDAFKDKWCKENNISLIRIPYTKFDSLTINDLIL